MRLKKALPKLKAILLAIDMIIAVMVVAVLGYCGYLIYRIQELPDTATQTAATQTRLDAISQLESDIRQKTEEIARKEEQTLAALQEAQITRSGIQEEFDLVFQEHADLTGQMQAIENCAVLQQEKRDEIARIRTEYGQACRKLEDMILAGESDYRICYLTFDDGPSYLTPNFLDRIDELDIRVTFFTIGVQMQKPDYPLRDELMRREALSGHAIANHTYTHNLGSGIGTGVYGSLDTFMDAVKKQDELVYDVVGYHPNVFRFPAGSYYCPFRTRAIEELEKLGYGHIDWIGNAYDSGKTKTAAYVSSNVVSQARQDKVTVILMHDWRTETLTALRTIVNTLKAENYLFLPLFKESSTIGTATPKWG